MTWPAFRLRHYGGTLTDTNPLKISLTRRGHGISIRNKESAHGMEVSFDAGHNWYLIPAGQEFKEDSVALHYFYVRAVVANVAWVAVVKEG